MRLRTPTVALVLLGALAACSHGAGLPRALNAERSASGSSTGVDVVPTGQPSAGSTIPGAKATASSGHSSSSHPKSGSASNTSQNEGPRLAPPGGSDLSGVICNYVSRSDVNAVLPGTPPGVETDLASVAVSYCDFGSTSIGDVTVGVKNMGTAETATGEVRQRYAEMVGQSDQSVHTATVSGAFAFQVSSVTHLPSGKDLYAVNAQGSRGSWYVNIQYYSHSSCSTSAMQRLLQTVLSKVP